MSMADKETQSETSSHSSTKTNISTVIALKKAKAQAARIKVQYALKQSALLKDKARIEANRAQIDADMQLLAIEAEAEAFEAEVSVLEESLNEAVLSVPEEKMSTEQRVAEFVNEHCSIQTEKDVQPEEDIRTDEKTDQVRSNIHPKKDTRSEEQHINKDGIQTVVQTEKDTHRKEDIQDEIHTTNHRNSLCDKTNECYYNPSINIKKEKSPVKSHNALQYEPHFSMTQYLLKKELLINRLTIFNGERQAYSLWRRTFKSVVKEFEIQPEEEIDLLLKYAGAQSKRFIESIRLSNDNDMQRGIALIWERLNERFDAPEMVESSVRDKIKFFPRLVEKDKERWYDFLDILLEIESLKEDPKHSPLFAGYDTSAGLVSLVRKLPQKVQEKWVNTVGTYKLKYKVTYPSFSLFYQFAREICKIQNDPGLCFELDQNESSRPSNKDKRQNVVSQKTDVDQNASIKCPLHNTDHSLNSCRAFRQKPPMERKSFLKEKGICYHCCDSFDHKAKNCKKSISCEICSSKQHATALHKSENQLHQSHGGEQSNGTVNKCTRVCGTTGRSCAKILPVLLVKGSRQKKVYAILDEQSNRSLIKSDLFRELDLTSQEIQFSLSTCSGTESHSGRKATNLLIKSLDENVQLKLPSVIECNNIPNSRNEIPIPDVVDGHKHLRRIKSYIHPLDNHAEISILIGRDCPEAFHILDQIIGPPGSPYAQKTKFGWVIIGETCHGQLHKPQLTVNRTYLIQNDRPSHFEPCTSRVNVKEMVVQESPPFEAHDIIEGSDNIGSTIFVRTKNDDKPAPSIEDRNFILHMDVNFKRSSNGKWSSPLPFRVPRQKLPNNRELVLRRTKTLVRNLHKNSSKAVHFHEFMQGLIDNGHAEVAPMLDSEDECWYLPVFGVYHPKKPGQIRCVFDSSAKFNGVSLNDVLLSGPDMLNSLLGVLLRFRKEQVAIMADVQQMFYSFHVDEKDRNYLRFFWFRDNDQNKDLIEYQMTVHVFGNTSSPGVATYGLRRIAEEMGIIYGNDVKEFISRNFYVDDGLKSMPNECDAIDLMKRTQRALKDGGNLVLHKIASNSQKVMESFPADELSKELKVVDLSSEEWPVQRSLGLVWSIREDVFTFIVAKEERPFTRRAVLSVINSVYDPLGFASPVLIEGRLLLQDLILDGKDWDDPLEPTKHLTWKRWKESLSKLESLAIPRPVVPKSLDKFVKKDLHIYCDASQKAIAAVAYMHVKTDNQSQYMGFIFGKTRIAPKHGNTIPRLELCSAVLAVEIFQILIDELDLNFNSVTFHTDSKVVLGYINNETKRFYTYVSNRVEKIRKATKPYQWVYVNTLDNPADPATRGLSAESLSSSKWLSGPSKFPTSWKDTWCDKYPLVDPDSDKEIKLKNSTTISTKGTSITESNKLNSSHFERFSGWERLVNAVGILRHISESFSEDNKCHRSWHLCKEHKSVASILKSEQVIIRTVQSEFFSKDINDLRSGHPLHKSSSILALNPFLDKNGLLRVGGRLRNSQMLNHEKHPVIIPRKNHIASLLVKYFHEKVKHQGRQITEGSILSGGYWIIGAKRLISTYIQKCVKCRKLRGCFQEQLMADLPPDRVKFVPPFTYTGVDVFGPWTIVSRRTRGGLANSKRWAVLFTCLTIRAIHIEIVEEMSSSAFINALKRFVSIRGEVKEFRSDRGTNFIGASNELGFHVVNVEDDPMQEYLDKSKTLWRFNPPYSSNMGGAWERMIRTIRSVLNSILIDHGCRNLTHDNLVTFMAEVC